ncbi:MAG: hypothetical protein IJ851_06100 [Eubacterium sp.]|nr:hypothetical protein [Eubacterium sp.]
MDFLKQLWRKRCELWTNLRYRTSPNWTAFFDEDNNRYFAEIIYTSREGREQYNYEITQDIYSRLGTFDSDNENERLIKTANMIYSFENTMYGTLGPERTVLDEEAYEEMNRISDR